MQADSPHTTELELRKDHAAAILLQQRMLPRSPVQLAPFAINYEIAPASGLSGDFVAVVELADKRFLFIVADVAGHGTSGAMVTMWLKSFMCRLSGDANNTPAQVLSDMNTELLALELERHVCVVCGLVDQASALLTLACAGAYPKPLLTRANQSTTNRQEVLDTAGKALGLFAELAFEERSLHLQPGDRLTVVTDGVFELMDGADLQAKETRLAAAAAEPGAEQFWAALQVTPKQGCRDDVTWFQLEHLP